MGAQTPRADRNGRYVSEEDFQASLNAAIAREQSRIRQALRPGIDSVAAAARDAAGGVSDAKVGDKTTCPGCGETLTLDWADGWRNDRGLGCVGMKTHTDSLGITDSLDASANREYKSVRDVIAENGGTSPGVEGWA